MTLGETVNPTPMQLAQAALDRLADFGEQLHDLMGEDGKLNPADVMSLAEDWKAIEAPFDAAAQALRVMTNRPTLLGPDGTPLRSANTPENLGLLVGRADQMRAKLGRLWVKALNDAYLETAGLDDALLMVDEKVQRYIQTIQEKLADKEDDLRAANKANLELETKVGELEGQLAVLQVPAADDQRQTRSEMTSA